MDYDNEDENEANLLG